MIKKITRLLKILKYPPARKALLRGFLVKNQIQSQFSLMQKVRNQMESINLSGVLLPRPDDPRCFAFLRPGHCGSAWLSKLLNSHPDVICYHEGGLQRIFPLGGQEMQENDFIAWLYAMKVRNREIYRVIGDLGTITPNIATLPEIRERFAIFGLTRHGVLYIRSQIAGFGKSPEAISPALFNESLYYNEILERFPSLKATDTRNPQTKLFIFCCWNWLSCLEAPAIKTYRIEDFNKNVDLTARFFKEITGLDTAPTEAIKTMINQKIKVHVKTREYDPKKVYFEDWDDTQRFIFDTICGQKMKEWYEWPLSL